MAELRYQAFISYSHRDDIWAKWLHRAIESYRVPRKLVHRTTRAGEVPARIKPIFRDRDDLSSSSDLSNNVRQALADSKNLLVICSPSAVASRWVGEEIRQFAQLGRAERIFCIIVDGETADDGSVAALFPAALAEIGLQEPLAADARQWGDGKRVAKLKLIAGLLGIRTDELCQRDLQRQRKRSVVAGLGVMAALALGTITVLSQISKQHEREKAEQLAIFIVDLGERLRSDADLETLALIGTEAAKHFQNLDTEKLTANTAKKVALALRQMGHVGQLQGRSAEPLDYFTRSRDLLKRLTAKYPQTPGMLFELGNANYYVGNLHNELGEYDEARQAMQLYLQNTLALLAMNPANPDWIMEVSYAHNNLAALQIGSGEGIDENVLEHVAEATRLMEKVVALRPDDPVVADNYATLLAWAADAQRMACNLSTSLTLREKVKSLAEHASVVDPGNNDLKKRHAYALSGVASLQIMTGRLGPARDNLEAAIAMLEQLSAVDPSNIVYRQQVLYRSFVLAGLLGATGELETAQQMMHKLEPDFQPDGKLSTLRGTWQRDYIDFLTTYADIEYRSGDEKKANIH